MRFPLYREHAPPVALSAAVECFWTVRSAATVRTPALNRVLPDGCIDIIFNLGDAPLPEGRPTHTLRAYVVGAMTRALAFHHAGRIELVGVRFRPGAAPAFLRTSAGELTDRIVALDELDASLAGAAQQVLAAPDGPAALPALSSVLLARARPGPPPPRQRLAAIAWTRLCEAAGALPLGELAVELGTSPRGLQRTFGEAVGLTPRHAARVARLRRALAVMRRHPAFSLGRVAHEAGYHDQPHFNREFAHLAGVTPGTWRAERGAAVQAPAGPGNPLVQ